MEGGGSRARKQPQARPGGKSVGEVYCRTGPRSMPIHGRPIHGRSWNAILSGSSSSRLSGRLARMLADRSAHRLLPLPDLSHISASFSGDRMPSNPAEARPGAAEPCHELSGTELGLRLRTARPTKGWTPSPAQDCHFSRLQRRSEGIGGGGCQVDLAPLQGRLVGRFPVTHSVSIGTMPGLARLRSGVLLLTMCSARSDFPIWPFPVSL